MTTNKYPRGNARDYLVRNRKKGCYSARGLVKASYPTAAEAEKHNHGTLQACECPSCHRYHLRSKKEK